VAGWGGICVAGFKFIKFYFTSSVLNMFRILIRPSSVVRDFFVASPHWLCVLVSMCVGVSVWLFGVVLVWQAEACHTETPTHIETRTHNQCGDATKKSRATDDGCINIRNMLSTEEVK